MNSHFCPEIIKIHVCGDYAVQIDFADGITKVCDLSDHLEHGVFKAFRDKNFFRLVHVEHGAAVWNDKIDIAPEYLYEHGKIVTETD